MLRTKVVETNETRDLCPIHIFRASYSSQDKPNGENTPESLHYVTFPRMLNVNETSKNMM
jgi:hypothetical protein